MKEVKKCSLAGVAFTMDTDAYDTLEQYLRSLKESYKDTSEGQEIVADIEARIAELILSTQDNTRVVEKPLILNIIHQMGTPEDISQSTDSDLQSDTPRIPRRLYRDTENSKLGGVCAGIGKYFDIDPVWIRLGMFVPLILLFMRWIPFMEWTGPTMGNLFLILVICYLIMWFAVPAACSARQKLEMNGEKITAESIGQTTRSAAEYAPDTKAQSIVANVVSALGQVILILLKIFAGIIVFALIMTAAALIIAMSAILVGGQEMALSPAFLQGMSLWVPVLGIFIVLVPVALLIYVLMCLIASRKPGGKAVIGIFLVWLAGIIAFSSVAFHEHAGDKFLLKRSSVERVLERKVVIDGDTTTMEQMLQDFEDEKIVEEGRKAIHIRIPSKNIDITIDKEMSDSDLPAAIGSGAAPAETTGTSPGQETAGQ